MTEVQKNQRKMALATSGGFCEICGKTLTAGTWQGAHRIANTKMNRQKFGSLVIDHPYNIAIVCSLKCNQVCNIGYNTGACLELLQRILDYEKLKLQ